MDDDLTFVEAIQYDPEERLLLPFRMSGMGEPISMPDKLKAFERMAGKPPRSFDDLAERMTLIIQPLTMPRFNLPDNLPLPAARHIFVMGPTSGHHTTVYDLLSPEDQGITLSNQMTAVGWEVARQGLLRLGADVVVAEDIYAAVGIDVMSAQQGIMLPVQQMFPRDSGVPIAGKYIIASERAVHDFTINAVTSIHGPRAAASMQLQKLAELTAGLKPRHGQSVVDAFARAGLPLQIETIDAFFEGGDVIYDCRRGIIFIGDDKHTNQLYKDIGNTLPALKAEFKRVAAIEPTVIDRPFSMKGRNRHDGERFHLDCFMALLPKGEMLVDPRYTTPQSLAYLKKIYGDDLLVIGPENHPAILGPVGRGKVPNYTANLVCVGTSIVMPTCSPRLKATLQGRGYTVLTAENFGIPPGYFYLRGGGWHCASQDQQVLAL